jgi:hypothetical protein
VIVAEMFAVLVDVAAPAGAGIRPTINVAAAAANRILIRIALSFCRPWGVRHA